MTPDTINAAFELAGAFAAALNLTRLWRDRIVAGVDWRAFALFTAWGIWNLFYYRHLEQPHSALAAAALVIINIGWLALALYCHLERRRVDRLVRMPLVTRRART